MSCLAEGVSGPFTADSWLSEVAGFPCYKFVDSNTVPMSIGTLQNEMALIAGTGNAFFFAKHETNLTSGSACLERAGFSVVDTNMTMEWCANKLSPHATSDILIADALPEHHAKVKNIAQQCFRYSRFHLDPLFPANLANLIKRRWVESYCSGNRGAAIYLALAKNEPIGFLAVLETNDNLRVATIDLIGVAPEYQGRGVGSALISHFIKNWCGRVAKLRVGTQVANIPSLSLYGRFGFRIISSAYVLHAHYRNGVLSQ
jgi:dTDP-4-amino-4,6-dideoxy-D-galactose acyltransferase